MSFRPRCDRLFQGHGPENAVPVGVALRPADGGAVRPAPLPSVGMSLTRRALVLAVPVVMAGTVAACAQPVPDGIRAQSGSGQAAASQPPDGGRPTRIAIDHDDHHARHVGHTADGRQFFLTTPFVPGDRDFIALYIFDRDGRFLTAEIDEVTTKERIPSAAEEKIYQDRLDRIEIELFEVKRFGLTFGLIADPPDSGDDMWWVELEPGNYMAFFAPWDSGIYDT